MLVFYQCFRPLVLFIIFWIVKVVGIVGKALAFLIFEAVGVRVLESFKHSMRFGDEDLRLSIVGSLHIFMHRPCKPKFPLQRFDIHFEECLKLAQIDPSALFWILVFLAINLDQKTK